MSRKRKVNSKPNLNIECTIKPAPNSGVKLSELQSTPSGQYRVELHFSNPATHACDKIMCEIEKNQRNSTSPTYRLHIWHRLLPVAEQESLGKKKDWHIPVKITDNGDNGMSVQLKMPGQIIYRGGASALND